MGLISKPIPNTYKEFDKYVVLHIISAKYGEFDFIIDIDDYEKVKSKHWSIMKAQRKIYYIAFYATSGGILLHRYLVDAPKGTVVDHADGNTFNMRKYNLRTCTNTENVRNQKLSKLNKSGHKGVYWDIHIPTPKWRANIKVNNKTLHLGYFDRYEDACKVREKAELKYYGEYSALHREDKNNETNLMG